MSTVLETVESRSSDRVYEVRLGKDGVVYCTCPGWRNCKADPKDCRHLQDRREREGN